MESKSSESRVLIQVPCLKNKVIPSSCFSLGTCKTQYTKPRFRKCPYCCYSCYFLACSDGIEMKFMCNAFLNWFPIGARDQFFKIRDYTTSGVANFIIGFPLV